MPRLNPFALSRPDPISETRTFTDPLQPGEELTLTLRAKPDYGLQTSAVDKGSEYIRQYVTGYRANGKQYPAAATLPVAERPVSVSKSLCATIAMIETLQTPGEGEDAPYNFNEWLAISAVMPTAFGEIAEWANDLLNRATGEATPETEVPNGSAASTD